MNKELIAESSIVIHSNAKSVWKIMTEKEYIKRYLYGSECITDWKVGSSIHFKGEFNGHSFQDKGKVLENKAPNYLSYLYWSSFSGLEDKEENYYHVSYKIEDKNESVVLTWRQSGFPDEARREHTEKALPSILAQIKNIAENNE